MFIPCYSNWWEGTWTGLRSQFDSCGFLGNTDSWILIIQSELTSFTCDRWPSTVVLFPSSGEHGSAPKLEHIPASNREAMSVGIGFRQDSQSRTHTSPRKVINPLWVLWFSS